jgi:hypothetical protein
VLVVVLQQLVIRVLQLVIRVLLRKDTARSMTVRARSGERHQMLLKGRAAVVDWYAAVVKRNVAGGGVAHWHVPVVRWLAAVSCRVAVHERHWRCPIRLHVLQLLMLVLLLHRHVHDARLVLLLRRVLLLLRVYIHVSDLRLREASRRRAVLRRGWG